MTDAQSLLALGTSTISDALDRLGIAGQCLGIAPLDHANAAAGPAFTVRYESRDAGGGTVGDFLDDVPAGSVIAIDNQGRVDATVWGELMTVTACERRVSGTVIDGICRDVRLSLAMSYPLFTRGSWMRTGKDRVRLVAINEPVTIGGVIIRPHDVLVGDADGVVAVPAQSVANVWEVAVQIGDAETRIRDAVQRGTPLKAARAAVGYHALQSFGDQGPGGGR